MQNTIFFRLNLKRLTLAGMLILAFLFSNAGSFLTRVSNTCRESEGTLHLPFKVSLPNDESNVFLPGEDSTGCTSYYTATAGSALYSIHFEGFCSSSMPVTYTWNFGDQSSGNGQVIDHTYNAEGFYTVTLQTVDSSGCTHVNSSVISVFLLHVNTLSGAAYLGDDTTSSCHFKLYKQSESGSCGLFMESEPDEYARFHFTNVISGVYHLLAIPVPGTALARNFLPTFYGDSYLWTNDQSIILGNSQEELQINFQPFTSIGGGNGAINGVLNSIMSAISPANQEILILDMSGNPVRYDFTDNDGHFLFQSLPNGTYQVYANIPCVATTPAIVSLSGSSATATANLILTGNAVAGINDSRPDLQLRLYPNPTDDVLTLEFNKELIQVSGVEIVNSEGMIVKKQRIDGTLEEGVLLFSLKQLPAGLYTVRFLDVKGSLGFMKFVKI